MNSFLGVNIIYENGKFWLVVIYIEKAQKYNFGDLFKIIKSSLVTWNSFVKYNLYRTFIP